MSLLVEVFSVEKQCPVIINLEKVVEIAPWKNGGCKLFFDDFVGGKQEGMLIKDDFETFRPFAVSMIMEPVRVNVPVGASSITASVDDILEKELQAELSSDAEEVKKGPGRPKKV